jgi:hypothetical protein
MDTLSREQYFGLLEQYAKCSTIQVALNESLMVIKKSSTEFF